MTIRDRAKELKLDYGSDGLPFVRVQGKTSISTMANMRFGMDGLPFVAIEGTGPTPPAQPDGLVVMLIIAT
jgi:hypothetical protein